jgi:ketosteroid isomerase-like protein
MGAGADLIARLHDAFNRRDLEGVVAMLHPDVRFRDYIDDGEVRGLDEARAFYQRVFATIAPELAFLSSEELPDGRVVTRLQVGIHDRSGHLWSDSSATVTYVLADGLVLGLDIVED